MSSISAALGQSAGGVSFEHDGKTYSVSLITQGVKASLEKRLVDRALNVLERFRDLLPAKEYGEESLALFREIQSGKYAFHGEVCQAALKGADAVFFFAGLFGIAEEDMERLILAAGPKVVSAIQHATALSYPVPKEDAEKNDQTAGR